ncbi:Gag protease polyprotein [Gossypium australe]|uniref:Gag protease polyprotein n=1 Tax=Gossypium australe TaxID=47621 RepID=A0A5B6WB35_9ROSI|nr:Gag protease polyprotein [Gossypium australe]
MVAPPHGQYGSTYYSAFTNPIIFTKSPHYAPPYPASTHSVGDEKLKCAVSLLKGEAYQWWVTVRNIHPINRINWNFFVSEFKKKYVSQLYLKKKKREFFDLKQKNMFVAEYECKFTRLSKYAKELIADETDMCRRFEWGLNEEIYVPLLPLYLQEFPILVDRTQRLEEGLSHSKEKSMGKRSATSSLPPSSFKQSRDFKGSRYLAPVGGSKIRSQTRPTQQTTSRTGGSGRKSMTQCEQYEQSVKRILAQQGSKRSGMVSLVGKEQRKRISLRTPDGNEMIVAGENYSALFNVLSTMEAFKLVKKGHIAYLAYIFYSRIFSSKIEEIPVVREYPDVFPKELSGLPPEREVEFTIEIVPRTTSVSIAPY